MKIALGYMYYEFDTGPVFRRAKATTIFDENRAEPL